MSNVQGGFTALLLLPASSILGGLLWWLCSVFLVVSRASSNTYIIIPGSNEQKLPNAMLTTLQTVALSHTCNSCNHKSLTHYKCLPFKACHAEKTIKHHRNMSIHHKIQTMNSTITLKKRSTNTATHKKQTEPKQLTPFFVQTTRLTPRNPSSSQHLFHFHPSGRSTILQKGFNAPQGGLCSRHAKHVVVPG